MKKSLKIIFSVLILSVLTANSADTAKAAPENKYRNIKMDNFII